MSQRVVPLSKPPLRRPVHDPEGWESLSHRRRTTEPVRPPLGCILDAVGNTPMVRLDRYFPDMQVEVLAKLEGQNPAGSGKDRPALRVVEEALKNRALSPGSVVVESSSGNMGIGLAQVCRYYGLRLICVVDPKISPANLQLLQAWGVEVDRVEKPDPETGEFLQARIARVKEILAAHPGAFWPNQYANDHNALSHYHTTMEEILRDVGAPDYLFVATSTCGTIAGCARLIRDRGLPTQVVAVDAWGSQIFGSEKRKRLLPGLGASLRPPLCPTELIDDVILVSDLEAVAGCRRLLAREAIFAGASSGGVLAAMERFLPGARPGSLAVAVLPDRGERYLATVFSDSWVRENLGELPPI
ncbi:MAG TPA: 2,3-diaminopropionate biosynthesis protein SbnA [Thermoanaerobaculia bacterium]|nr:2,3-diaminopropionate biosynthesis protein SbnA [Thermoanaerobaculia bacterium]